MDRSSFNDNLHHKEPLFRDYEYNELLASFRGVLARPGEAIARVILIGPAGSGKSFVLRNFQNKIEKGKIVNANSHFILKTILVDCKNHSSSASVVTEMIQKFEPNFQARNQYQTAELQYILADILLEKKIALVIALDNIDKLVAKEPEEVSSLIYGFQRFSEGKTEDTPNLFSQILVARDLEFLVELDKSVFRRITTDVIPFEPYTDEQTFKILLNWTKRNIKEKRISEETIQFISIISAGNMNVAVSLIDGARENAKRNNQREIRAEKVREANKQLTDFQITERKINELPLGEKLLLLAIARRFRVTTRAFLNFLEIPGRFFSVCEEYNKLSAAKLFSYHLNNLIELAIISTRNINEELVIILSDISASELIFELEKSLKGSKKESQYYT